MESDRPLEWHIQKQERTFVTDASNLYFSDHETVKKNCGVGDFLESLATEIDQSKEILHSVPWKRLMLKLKYCWPHLAVAIERYVLGETRRRGDVQDEMAIVSLIPLNW